MKTLRELADDLATYDEVTVLELLDLESDMIVKRFMDRVEEREAYLRKALYANDGDGTDTGDYSDSDGETGTDFRSHFDGYDYDEWN